MRTIKYYKIQFELLSSLNIGSGEKESSDKDLLRNSNNTPYIPGTALAGVYRSLVSKEIGDVFFGNVPINTDKTNKTEQNNIESLIKTYDANIISEKYVINKRDCVGLDEFKTAIKGSKFDFEILEPKVNFVTYIEVEVKDIKYKNNIDEEVTMNSDTVVQDIIQYWYNKGLSFGSKTMRGLGKTKIESVTYKQFDLTKEEELIKWLDFDMYTSTDWGDFSKPSVNSEDMIKLAIEVKQKSGISIRKYSTDSGDNVPDYSQLMIGKHPVIPGTTWAGAFKHKMEELNPDLKEEINILFGEIKDHNSKNKNTEHGKSKIFFSETIINTEKSKIMSHNAINRFTGGVKASALFTEKYYYGGNGVLTISLPKETSLEIKRLLAASIMDLHHGYLSIGGQTAIGRELFEVVNVNESVTEITYNNLLIGMGCVINEQD